MWCCGGGGVVVVVGLLWSCCCGGDGQHNRNVQPLSMNWIWGTSNQRTAGTCRCMTAGTEEELLEDAAHPAPPPPTPNPHRRHDPVSACTRPTPACRRTSPHRIVRQHAEEPLHCPASCNVSMPKNTRHDPVASNEDAIHSVGGPATKTPSTVLRGPATKTKASM